MGKVFEGVLDSYIDTAATFGAAVAADAILVSTPIDDLSKVVGDVFVPRGSDGSLSLIYNVAAPILMANLAANVATDLQHRKQFDNGVVPGSRNNHKRVSEHTVAIDHFLANITNMSLVWTGIQTALAWKDGTITEPPVLNPDSLWQTFFSYGILICGLMVAHENNRSSEYNAVASALILLASVLFYSTTPDEIKYHFTPIVSAAAINLIKELKRWVVHDMPLVAKAN